MYRSRASLPSSRMVMAPVKPPVIWRSLATSWFVALTSFEKTLHHWRLTLAVSCARKLKRSGRWRTSAPLP
jgi:hypothetical protein